MTSVVAKAVTVSLLAAATFCLAAVSTSPAQGIIPGNTARISSIKGVVTDGAQGLPLPGARVQLIGTTLESLTDNSGAFLFSRVPCGVYSLSVTHPSPVT